jgi:hypothetical protein
MRYLESQNKYVVNESQSPVIEYFKSFYNISTNEIRRGRIYFEKMMFIDNEFIPKNEEIILKVEELFKWYKKHFRNAKINIWHTTYRTAQAITKNQLVTIKN